MTKTTKEIVDFVYELTELERKIVRKALYETQDYKHEPTTIMEKNQRKRNAEYYWNNRKKWQKGGEYYERKEAKLKQRKGHRHGYNLSKYTDNDIRKIAEMKAMGMKTKEISKITGFPKGTIGNKDWMRKKLNQLVEKVPDSWYQQFAK